MPVKFRKLRPATPNPATVPTHIPFPDQQLLRVTQAARFLGTSAWAVRELVHDGRLKPIIIGNRHHFDRDDLLAFIEKAKVA
jgi:excisionase family DNA binding protein